MPRFREIPSLAQGPTSEPRSLSTAAVRRLVEEVLAPANFFVGKSLPLQWQHTDSEIIPWELCRGRLLNAAYTTARQSFEAWNICVMDENGPAAEPLLSVKLGLGNRQLHIVRGIYCHAWEGYHDGDNVYLSREICKWVRELAGTVHLDRFDDVDEMRDEVVCRIFHAVVGASRLPLTSIEAPLPAFSLGELAYCYRSEVSDAGTMARPMQSPGELLLHALNLDLCWLERAKLLEAVLRATPLPELGETLDLFVARWHALGQNNGDIIPLLRTLFNEVSLSPYTDFVDRTLQFLQMLTDEERVALDEVADFLGHLLRQTCRHLTAYDLVTFHHRGANYPDALLLDAALKNYLALMERNPDLFVQAPGESEGTRQNKRLRRRALRQGWLLRHWYEGHLVPDAPTSEGESMRVLPPPHLRVPHEQIIHPHRRTRRLYDGDPLIQHVGSREAEILQQSIADLAHDDELRELGMAIFLDRPLSAGKTPGEVDQTPLLSYEAFSRSVAERRLLYLADKLNLITDQEKYEAFAQRLRTMPITGMPVEKLCAAEKNSVISLADAAKAAPDFVFLRTTPQTARDFLSGSRCGPALDKLVPEFLNGTAQVLILRESANGRLAVYDAEMRKRLELEYDPTQGYESRGGIEYPVGGLRLVQDHGISQTAAATTVSEPLR